MTGALVILLFLTVVGIILWFVELYYRRRHPDAGKSDDDAGEAAADGAPEAASLSDDRAADVSAGVCCGQHLVCEKDTLSPLTDEILYYDDEELDRFIDREADSYTPEEEEEFREVLLTLRPEDVVGWARSITLRRLNLPTDVRDALLMLVNEQRNKTQ